MNLTPVPKMRHSKLAWDFWCAWRTWKRRKGCARFPPGLWRTSSQTQQVQVRRRYIPRQVSMCFINCMYLFIGLTLLQMNNLGCDVPCCILAPAIYPTQLTLWVCTIFIPSTNMSVGTCLNPRCLKEVRMKKWRGSEGLVVGIGVMGRLFNISKPTLGRI